MFDDPTRNSVIACPGSELDRIPAEKRLGGLGPDRGLPIGNLTSQFLANVLLNELDQHVKHVLKVRWYLRYVDDMVLVSRDPAELRAWAGEVRRFLGARLSLALKEESPDVVPVSRGVDFLGYVVRPHYRLVRRRVVGNLWRRLEGMKVRLVRECRGLEGGAAGGGPTVRSAVLDVARARQEGVVPALNSYLGHFRHARATNTLRRIRDAFPYLEVFVEFCEKKPGVWVARDRFRPPRRFSDLVSQWCFFRRLGRGLLGERALLCLRIGRYYEMFDEDAEVGTGALGLRPLRPRKGFDRRCGWPRRDLERFVGQALTLGRDVVVVEETGRPLGHVMERQVAAIHRRT